MGRGLSKPDHMTDEEYAEYKTTAEGSEELTQSDTEDLERMEREAEEIRQYPLYHYMMIEFKGEKLDDRIVANVYVKDCKDAPLRKVLTMERRGYNFGDLRSFRIRYGGEYNHETEAERQIQRLERGEGFFIDTISFYR